MDRNVKIILIVAGIVGGVAAISITLYFVLNKDKTGGNGEEEEMNPYATDSDYKSVSPTRSSGSATGSSYMIAPTFNSEGELSNSIQQLKGRTLYPKTIAEGGWDYSNVRSSAEVNTDQGWWDYSNKLTTIYKGNPIGKVLSDTTTTYNSYPYRWFKVKLFTPVSTTWRTYDEAYVRADTVSFKAI